jgi:hypothetical protein
VKQGHLPWFQPIANGFLLLTGASLDPADHLAIATKNTVASLQ